MPLLTMGRAIGGLGVAMEAPEAAKHGKRYTRQQRQARKQVNGPHPPGGAPPMRKVSAKQGLRFYLKKQSSMGRAFLHGTGMAAGTTAAGIGMYGAAKGVGSVYQRFAAGRMFDELKRRYPEIRRKEKEAREAFDLAIAYAPSLMKHPAAIGDFVRRQLEFPMSSHEYLKQLADLENSVSNAEAHGAPAQFAASVGAVPKYMDMYSKSQPGGVY